MPDFTPEQIEAGAHAGAIARRGVTAKPNNIDRVVARDVLEAAAEAGPKEFQARVGYPGEYWHGLSTIGTRQQAERDLKGRTDGWLVCRTPASPWEVVP